MITPCRVMIKALEPVTEFAVKVYCNDTQFPFTIEDHGVHFDIYRNVDMNFYSVDTVFECSTEQMNLLSLVWTEKPEIDIEIDDIELDYLYIDKVKLMDHATFFHVETDTLLAKPNEFGPNYWKPATWINNPGIFYLLFSLPIEKWCFNND